VSDKQATDGAGSARPAARRPSWWIYQGSGVPMDPGERDRRWPAPPPWRDFRGGPDLPHPADDGDEGARRLGATPAGLLPPAQVAVVNAAIYLRRPLLVTGRPGSGKSSLAHLVARELRLGPVLRWPVTSRTTLRSGLYDYDAIGRAQATLQLRGGGGLRWPGRSRPDEPADAERPARGAPAAPIGDFIRLGPVGTALLSYQLPRVLLVDEMDKADFDLPNDLLNIFEDGEFAIPELVRMGSLAAEVEVHTADHGGTATVRGGLVRPHAFPIVVITSNGEREFPAAFLRRCIRLAIADPDVERLAALVAAHFPAGGPAHRDLVTAFAERRAQVGALAADQLLNAAHLATSGAAGGDPAAWNELLETVWHQLEPMPDLR
jgi:MoxR-like ATPase